MKTLAILFLLTLIPSAQASNDCEDTVVINLAFDYPNGMATAALAGTKKDMENLKEIYGEGPNVHYLHFNAGNSNKKDLLNELRKRIGDHKHVIFNYSGHGEVEKFDPRFNMASAAKAVEALGKNDGPAPVANSLRNDQFQILLPNYFECKIGANQLCVSTCGVKAEKVKVDSILKACREVCKNTSVNTPMAKCYDNLAINNDDLSNLFRGKRVDGMIDACHSGALNLKNVDYNFIVSADAGSTAPDTPDGGLLSNAAKDLCINGTDEGSFFGTQHVYSRNGSFKAPNFQLTGFPVWTRASENAKGVNRCLLPKDGVHCGLAKRQPSPPPATDGSEGKK